MRKHFDLDDVVEQAIPLSYLAHKELMPNKKDVGQTFHFMDVAKVCPHLCRFFATFDVCKLIVYQVKANDGCYRNFC